MRLFGRNDSSLAAALIVATFILFREPLRYVMDAAHEFERQYHVDLVESLVVLGVVFAFHQFRKRQEAKSELKAAAAAANQSYLRAQELECLVGFSRALAMCTDFKGLHLAFSRYVPQFIHERDFWVLICHESCWDVLVRADVHPAQELEGIGERALRPRARGTADVAPVRVDDMMCFPMLVGARPAGVIIVREAPALTLDDRHALEAAAALSAVSIRNVQTLIETRDLSLRDGLTGCFNRAHALSTIDAELRRARRTAASLSLIMFDIDRFKSVNDEHGHLAGDRVLCEVGRCINEVLRSSDIKCRYGGDEFLLVLPDTVGKGALQVAESLRQQISRIVIEDGEASRAMTASLGVATSNGHGVDVLAFVASADRALYQAKDAGRNCVRCTDQSEPVSRPS